MGQISLNYEDALRVLNNKGAAPDSRVIAACAVAMMETAEHAEDIDTSTRAIALKLSHMIAAEIYGAEGGA